MSRLSNNQDVVQKLYGEVLDSNGNLDRDKVMYKLNSAPDNDFHYKFTNDVLNGPILLMYSKRKVVFTIRLDKSMKTPKWICVSGYTETTKTGSPLNPESRSKYKYFRSVNNYATHALNTYVSYEEVPLLPLIEWWKNFSKFPDKFDKITENRLYWSQEFNFLPTDFCSIELKETDLIHKASIVFK